jgi:hypothetical protein
VTGLNLGAAARAVFLAAAVSSCSVGAGGPGHEAETEPRKFLLAPDFAPYGGRIEAWQSSEGLCMLGVFPLGGESGGGCGYRDNPTGGRVVSGITDDGKSYVFGPLPEQARTVLLRAEGGRSREVPTAPLPTELALGRYFFAGEEVDGQITEVVPLDADGKALPPRDF